MKGEQHFAASIMNKKDLLYYIKPEQQNEKDLHTILAMHPEIQFVSLMGVDFAGNDTDEKIPMKIVWVLIAAAIVYGILRNIPIFSFLAPLTLG
mgnify:CR=1 FL=1